MPFQPSIDQIRIFCAMVEGTGDIQIIAGPGSGKTTTLVEGIKFLPQDVIESTVFMAFSKEIEKTLKEKQETGQIPPEATIRTIYAMGFGAFTRHMSQRLGRRWAGTVKEERYRKLIESYWRSFVWPGSEEKDAEIIQQSQDAMLDLVKFARLTLHEDMSAEGIARLAAEREVLLPMADLMTRALPMILEWGVKGLPYPDEKGNRWTLAECIDFTDMVWLPWKLNLTPDQYKMVLVDEQQDLSAAQIDLVLKCRAPNGRIVAVGDPCQPEGTQITVVTKMGTRWNQKQIKQVPIEKIKIGDRVTSYTPKDCAFVQGGRLVTGITKRPFRGELIVATTEEGHTTKYTPNHICFASFAPIRDKYCVYLMGRGDQYRIGKSKISREEYFLSGPISRMRQEGADTLWLLALYDTDQEARIAEGAITGKFGLPQLIFKYPGCGVKTQETIDNGWVFIGNNTHRAIECLEYFDRDIRYPIVSRETHPTYATLKRPMEVRACNLMDGVLMLPYEGETHTSRKNWLPIHIRKEHHEGYVYSLDIEKERLYVADGLVTHNCQAIFAFAGADAKAFDYFQEVTNAMRLPLMTCYRCPLTAIRRAQKISDTIQPAPGAIEGVEDTLHVDTVPEVARPGDMILCRVNAPLITMAFQLIAQGKPATVRGRNIGTQLVKVFDAIGKIEGFDFDRFIEASEKYRDMQLSFLRQKENNEGALIAVNERVDSVQAVYAGAVDHGARTLGDLRRWVQDLFADEQRGQIILSSIHRAKGLEADRVFFLHPEKVPHPMAKSAAAREQETNLLWVCFTRNRKEFYYIDHTPRKKEILDKNTT